MHRARLTPMDDCVGLGFVFPIPTMLALPVMCFIRLMISSSALGMAFTHNWHVHWATTMTITTKLNDLQ